MNNTWPNRPHTGRVLFIFITLFNLLFASTSPSTAAGVSYSPNVSSSFSSDKSSPIIAKPLANQTSVSTNPTSTDLTQAFKDKVRTSLSSKNGSFEANEGQFDSRVKFNVKGQGYNLHLTSDGAVLDLLKTEKTTSQIKNSVSTFKKDPQPSGVSLALAMTFVGANPSSKISGQNPLNFKTTYFGTKYAAQTYKDITSYGQVAYKDIYPGIDLTYYYKQNQLEYDFILSPGVNVNDILIQFDNASDTHIAPNGDAVIVIKGEEVRHSVPQIYQVDGENQKKPVKGGFVIRDNNRIGFEVGEYDRKLPLVIDPSITYATYISGSAEEEVSAVSVDKQGYVYATGWTLSTDLDDRLTGENVPNNAGKNAFLLTLYPDGSVYKFAYLGGWQDDEGTAITLDNNGTVYIAGNTRSYCDGFGFGNICTYASDHPCNVPAPGQPQVNEAGHFPLPITANAYQCNLNNTTVKDLKFNAFFAQINSASSVISYCTYFGGTGYTIATGIAVDDNHYVYLTGETL